jgi:glyoxylase-like metal-dependent hydrolase (beta-lactamase superfamily II)
MSRSSPALAIHALDLGFCNLAEVIAAYLVVGPKGPVLVETGPGSTLPALLERLDEHGYGPDDVRDVLVTHIHLDHAGASGWWARRGSRVYVHHVGAPHLIAPERLMASAGRIYGDMMDRLWGEMVPAPENRVIAISDGDIVRAGGLEFVALDTPGHAGHHHAYRLGNVVFTGDVAGIRLPAESYVAMPTPPPEFHLETWCASVDRLAGEGFARLYPTHFGAIEDPASHWDEVKAILTESSEMVRRLSDDGAERESIVREYMAKNRERCSAHGVSESALARYECVNPSGMSVDGILRYWRKRRDA